MDLVVFSMAQRFFFLARLFALDLTVVAALFNPVELVYAATAASSMKDGRCAKIESEVLSSGGRFVFF